jgi:aldose 1-epimerase
VAEHRLTAHGYDLTVDAQHGASLTSLRWQKPDGTWFDVLHPCSPAIVARTGGCFVMAPFANRLDGGLFPLVDGPVQLPLNRPEENLAIHGFSRDRAWKLVEATDDRLTLFDDFAETGNPFAYTLTQEISFGASGVQLALRLTNTATVRLPYGLGFHPWFRKTANTWLSFDATTQLGRDQRGFATKPVSEGPSFPSGVDVSAMPSFDSHYAGWTSRSAAIDWRPEGVRLNMQARGALTNLQVYVPDGLPVLCVEPVSHVPDVHNRRDLARYGDVALLATAETIEGAMILRCFGDHSAGTTG